MKLRPEEITSILKQRIEEYDVETDLAEVGTVLQVGDGIARVYGLENASRWRCSSSSTASPASRSTSRRTTSAALFGEWEQVKEGEPVQRTGTVASVPVGDALIGRIVDPLGNPLDGQGPIETDETGRSSSRRRASSTASR